MKIKVLIVDDEPLARERVRTLLSAEADIEIAGECSHGDDALEQVGRHRPDLMFLDVQMPRLDGFAVVRAIPAEAMPLIIFVTAYDAHAVRAFEVHALDYLLKPFRQIRLREALQRARDTLRDRRQGEVADRLSRLLTDRETDRARATRIPVRIADRIIFVKTEQIDWVEAAGNYAVLHCGREKHIIRSTLGTLEETLPTGRFLRVSRSAIVNGERVKELQPVFHGEQILMLEDGTRVPVTRGLREIQDFLRFI